jgi:uncharacterized protein (DUF1697 family)
MSSGQRPAKAVARMSKPATSAGMHIALLRGINVGGKNMLPMKDLAALFVAAGCGDVKTYIQSGNVVCQVLPAVVRNIRPAIEDAILKRFGYRIPIVMRTGQEFRDVVTGNPFLKAGVVADVLHVGFLADMPSPERIAALDPHRSAPDEFVVRGREVYFRFPNGVARTKFTNQYFDSKLATTITIRNWRTVMALAEVIDR